MRAFESKTGRLRLVALRKTDAEALRRITDDPAITGAIDFLPSPFTVWDAERFIEGEDGDRIFGAWHRDGGDLIGVVGTHPRGEHEIEIGYWIATPFIGEGYASEAAAGAIEIVKAMYPGRQIYAECRPENSASWRVLEKLGFRPTGESGTRPGRKKLALFQPSS